MNTTLAIYGIKDRFVDENPTYVHDHNLCVMHKGNITQYLHLERYTRRKFDNRLDLFIETLIDEKLLNLPNEFDIISVDNFVASAFISKNGRLQIQNISTKENPDKHRIAKSWFEKEKFNGKELNAKIIPHELAHIFSCIPFFGKFKENSLLIHFDGGASVSNFSAFTFKNNKINYLESHWELAHLSKFFNDNALNFAILNARKQEHLSVPGKLMGFASFGTYSKKIENWLNKNNYFKNIWNNYDDFSKKAKENFNIDLKTFDTTIPFLQDIAATFQHIFTQETIKKLNNLKDKTNTDYLYYTGGSALNIVTNSKIIQSKLFKNVFIPPCTNDAGLSIGAAAYNEWKKDNNITNSSPYLNNIGLDFCNKLHDSNLIKKVAKLLLNKKVIGIANGAAEIGPRALGNRSIIALANNKKLANKVSTFHKKREWYRPIAPVMLKNIADMVTNKNVHHLSKYMLLDYKILPKYETHLEGVTHINKTARIQTISERNENPFIYDLLSYLYNKHNVYALINTSFNIKGEPIVHTKKDALKSAKKMNLDAVIIDFKLINI